MQLFYSTEIEDNLIYLKDQEARHCAQVLRKQVGDEIKVTDGRGKLFSAVLIKLNKHVCELTIHETKSMAPHAPYLHVGIVPTKNIDRVELFLEKATELGINEVSLLLADHSERKKVRFDRLQKILLSAMKQSLNTYLPKLNDIRPLKEWILNSPTNDQLQKFIPHCYNNEKQTLKQAYVPGNEALILIGPEGDFSLDEVELALQNKFIPISLGETRLRTETAAISVCAFFNWMNL